QPLNQARETAEVLAEWKRDPATLRQRFDANGDGQIDLAEWERARNEAAAIIATRAREAALDPGIHLMSRPPDARPYILSVLPETALTNRFRVLAGVGLLLFLVADGATVFAVLARLGA